MNDHSDDDSVTLRASRSAMVWTVIALVGFDALAIAVIALNGLNVATVLIAALALMSTIVILLDLPVDATFDGTGVQRTTPLRRHRIEWGEIDQLVRMRRGGVRRPGSGKYRGVVAVCGRKRTVLVDCTESIDQHARLMSVLGARLAADRFESLERHRPVDGVGADPSEPE